MSTVHSALPKIAAIKKNLRLERPSSNKELRLVVNVGGQPIQT